MTTATILPPLRGTLKQIYTAGKIREQVLRDAEADGWNGAQTAWLPTVDDATWWIANRQALAQGPGIAKSPEPYQRVGGPPPPPDSQLGRQQAKSMQPDLGLLAKEPESRSNDAARFAASVSKTPALAEVAILALMARLYKEQSPVRIGLVNAAQAAYARYQADQRNNFPKDVEAIQRILSQTKP